MLKTSSINCTHLDGYKKESTSVDDNHRQRAVVGTVICDTAFEELLHTRLIP